jgi:hypothetical protein
LSAFDRLRLATVLPHPGKRSAKSNGRNPLWQQFFLKNRRALQNSLKPPYCKRQYCPQSSALNIIVRFAGK